MDKILIQEQDFNIQDELNLVRNNNTNTGAIVSFIGTVREISANNKLTKMSIEHYPKMTEKSLMAIIQKTKKKWHINDTIIIHRIGELKPNEQIVLVITTSKHRENAFLACQFIMDYLKTSAPFWKKEYTKNSQYWVAAQQKDFDKV